MKNIIIVALILIVIALACVPKPIGGTLGTVVYTSGIQKLTEKELITPIIGSFYVQPDLQHLLTMPVETGTLATQAWVASWATTATVNHASTADNATMAHGTDNITIQQAINDALISQPQPAAGYIYPSENVTAIPDGTVVKKSGNYLIATGLVDNVTGLFYNNVLVATHDWVAGASVNYATTSGAITGKTLAGYTATNLNTDNFTITNIPHSDPHVAGALYIDYPTDNTTVKISGG